MSNRLALFVGERSGEAGQNLVRTGCRARGRRDLSTASHQCRSPEAATCTYEVPRTIGDKSRCPPPACAKLILTPKKTVLGRQLLARIAHHWLKLQVETGVQCWPGQVCEVSIRHVVSDDRLQRNIAYLGMFWRQTLPRTWSYRASVELLW
jgi:hypothetical protein